MQTFLQDVRYGLRTLRNSPGFTVIALITLALGIGANTAIFAVINAVLLRPLPFPHPERLMAVLEKVQQPDSSVPELDSPSYPDFIDWRSQNHVFESIASWRNNPTVLTGVQQALHLEGKVVSADFFSTLGVQPSPGRGFTRAEEKAGTRVVVISHALWQSTFGGDPGIVGRNITLNSQSYTVVGVAPAGFLYPIQTPAPQVWTTLALDAQTDDPKSKPATEQRGLHMLQVVGRLKEGTTLSQARAEMELITQGIAKQNPENKRHSGAQLTPELDDLVGDVKPALMVLLAAVGCVLLIACANLANLLLARATNRVREVSIRIALGATRRRIIGQMLLEGMLLGLGGSVLGLLMASSGLRLLTRIAPQDIPRLGEIRLDGTVLAFAVLLGAFTAIAFALVPAMQTARAGSLDAMRGATGSVGASRQQHRLRRSLVVAETAIGLVLLVSAGLLLRSFQKLLNVDPGLDPRGTLTFRVDLPAARYTEGQKSRFYDQLTERLSAIPGVSAAAAVVPVPTGRGVYSISFEIEGQPVAKGEEPEADIEVVSPGYFKTLGIPVISGREFTAHDNVKAPGVVVINQAFARRYFPNQNPIGKRMEPGFGTTEYPKRTREIVGVVGDVRLHGMNADAAPEYYVPYAQGLISSLTLCVKSQSDPLSLTSAVRREVQAMDKEVPIFNVRPLEEYIAGSMAESRFAAFLLGSFASLAL
ncbi:MAG TPA: ABC transporter permease, partial [Alphaproteobacteria bacterium]|nr:ABC transporter permease [Alphaproteobacteria bacterium]